MPKYYVESGNVRLTIEAANATDAAISTFQWSCERQAELEARSPLDRIVQADHEGYLLDDEIDVSQRGFGRNESGQFETWDIVLLWQERPLPL